METVSSSPSSPFNANGNRGTSGVGNFNLANLYIHTHNADVDAEMLVRRGADPNLKHHTKKSAADYARISGYTLLSEYLIKEGTWFRRKNLMRVLHGVGLPSATARAPASQTGGGDPTPDTDSATARAPASSKGGGGPTPDTDTVIYRVLQCDNIMRVVLSFL